MDKLTFLSLATHQPRRAVAYRYPVLRDMAVSVECAQCANNYITDLATDYDGMISLPGLAVIDKTELATRDQVHSIVCPQCHQLMEFE